MNDIQDRLANPARIPSICDQSRRLPPGPSRSPLPIRNVKRRRRTTLHMLLRATSPHSRRGPSELKLQHPNARPMPVSGHELPFGRRVPRLASEVAAGAGVFEEFAYNVPDRVHENTDADVYVVADLLPDGSWDVRKRLMEDGTQHFGLLNGEIRIGRSRCRGGAGNSRLGWRPRFSRCSCRSGRRRRRTGRRPRRLGSGPR